MSSGFQFGLSPKDLAELFPFHLIFTPALRVLQLGAVLARSCPELKPGVELPDHFRLLRPALPWSQATAAASGILFMLEHVQSGLVLKGEIRALDGQDCLLFVGVPWVTNLGELQQRGLSISDFPIYEPLADYLFLLQGKNTALAETERLAAAVTAQRLELRIANRMLTAEFEVSQGLVEAKTLPEACDTFLSAVVRHLGWDAAALWLYDELEGLHCAASTTTTKTKKDEQRAAAALAAHRRLVEQAHERGESLCGGLAPAGGQQAGTQPPPYRDVLVIPLPGLTEHTALLQVFRDDETPLEKSAMATLLSVCARLGQFIERQRAHAALADERARLQAVLARTGALIYSASYDELSLSFISDNVKQVLGYDREQVQGIFWSSLLHVHPDDRGRLRAALSQLHKGPLSIDYRICRADGSCQWRSDYLRLVHDEQRQSAEIFGASLDLSDRKDAEAALRDSEARLRAVLDSAAEGIIAVEEDGTVDICNEVAARTLGRPNSAIIGQPVSRIPEFSALLQPGTPDSQPGRVLPTGVHELEGVRADGTSYSLSLSISEVATDKRRLFVGIMRDLTEERRANRELQRAKAVAESAYRAKSEFLAVVSHEIRTPLNVIIGMTELALGSKSPAEQQEFLSRVRTNAEALLNLIHSMLDLSKIEASLVEIEAIPFNCAQLVSDVADAVGSRLMNGKVELVCAVSPEVPPQLIGDPIRLRQILMNLLGNASKFTEQGEIHMLLEVVECAARSARLRFVVRDTGIGIPHEVQSRIFERFFQADSSTSRRFGGSGLGLTISRSLVELMGGRIWFESTPGCGSTFYFELPFGVAPTERLEPPPVSVAHLHVLIVDDNPVSCQSMAAVLRHRGFQVRTAANGQEARELLRQRPRFAAVILDSNMELATGGKLAAALIQEGALYGTKLILATQLWVTATLPTSGAQSSADYLIKPVSNARLLDAVERATGVRAASPTQQPDSNAQRAAPDRPFRILVVEDNVDNQRLAWHTLTKAGYHPELAENGVIAVAKAAQHDYDLIFMDIEMPELDGFQATAQIRRNESERGRNRVPIVAVTAHAVPAFRQKCLDVGMDDYVTKPMPRQRLLELVNRWLDRRPVILAADDSADGRILLRQMLQQAGSYRLVLARNGQEAVDQFRRLEVSLVLLDMEMPVMDGYAAAAAIRATPQGKTVPIVALTGHQGPEEIRRTRAAGCLEHLSKPVRQRELLLLVDRLLMRPASAGLLAKAVGQMERLDNPGQSAELSAPEYEPVPLEILDLVPGYLSYCRAEVATVRSLLHSKQFQRIKVMGHNMKGTAPSYGFPLIGELAARLERHAQQSDGSAVAATATELEAHLATLPQ